MAENRSSTPAHPTEMEGGTGVLVTAREAPEQVADEARLRAAMRRLDVLLGDSPLAVIEWSPVDLRIVRWSAGAARTFGWSAEEAVGKRMDELRASPDDRPLVERVADVLDGKRTRDVSRTRNVRKDGAVIHCEWYNSTVADSAGELAAVLSLVVDATERVRAEEQLRHSEPVYRAIARHIPGCGLYVMGRDLRYLVVEGSLPPVLGMERQGLEGQTIDEALEVELRRIVQERWRRALAGETASYDWEYRGRVLWSHYVPLKDDSGGIPAAMCLSLDITDRKRAEEALRESETLYRLLFSLAPSGVVLNDADGRIVAFNDRAHEQLGYTRDEFGRMSISDVDADEEPDDVRCRVAEIAAAGGAEYEVHHRAKSGEIRNVLVETRPIDVGGERRFLSVWQDITDRKRVEEALREMDRRKSEFLAVLSHELRNPLAPIRNSIYLLDRAAPGSRQAARAREVILRQTEQLSRLVDDLLDVTRISRGKVTLNRVGVDLRDVVRHTCDDHRSLFEGSEVELRVEAPAAPVWIEADATRISQVLGNLLQNAVKFTPSGGGVMVGVRTRADHAELSVRDNGIGMNPDQVERMFEPFAQAEQGLARTTGGLGLGLALVKGLVELHGGSVHARSEGLGRGSEFVVSLPLVLQPPAKLAATPVIAPATPGRHVLIIEDNVDAGQVLAAILELGGHSVRVARDGRSGVAMARELKPDVVVCDIGLPDVDGYEVARMLRAEEGLRATRLIAISGYAQPEDKQRAKDAGFDAHLAKPASLDELNALLAAPGGAAA